jgi:hypothetical protein
MDRIWYFYDILREEENVSFTPLADHNEYVRVEKLQLAASALKDAAAWISHWSKDRDARLLPTLSSLELAAAEISAALGEISAISDNKKGAF